MSTNETERIDQVQRVNTTDPLHNIEPFHTSNDGTPDAEHVSEWERLNAVQLPEIGRSNRPTGKKDPQTR